MGRTTFRDFLRGAPAWRPGTPWWWPWAIIAAALVFLASQLVGIGFAIVLPGERPSNPDGLSARLMQILLVTQAAIVLLVTAIAALRRDLDRSLHLQPPVGGWRTYGYALAVLVPLVVITNAVSFSINPADPLSDLRQFLGIARSANPIVPGLVICLGAPLSEELLFRGLLLPPLTASRLGYWPAAVIVVVAWTALHWGYSWAGLLEVFMIGLFLSWTLWKTNSLRVPIFCHAIYNTVLFLGLRYWPG